VDLALTASLGGDFVGRFRRRELSTQCAAMLRIANSVAPRRTAASYQQRHSTSGCCRRLRPKFRVTDVTDRSEMDKIGPFADLNKY